MDKPDAPRNSTNLQIEVDVQPSDLGKKEFWDSQYKTELNNFLDHGDEGEVWFGNSVMNRIIRWCVQNPSLQKNVSVLDVGCGNGLLGLELVEKGFTNVLGVDYSDAAIELSKKIATERELEANFEACDVLSDENSLQGRRFGLILDKGTYDAISLSENGLENRHRYIEHVAPLLEENGRFVLTTCNWTEEEIKKQMSSRFEPVETIPTPTFQFGGQKGNNVAIVVFKRKSY